MNSPEKSMTQAHQRDGRRLLIDPRFQLPLIGTVLAATLICFGAAFFQTYRAFSKLRELGAEAKLSPQNPLYHFLDLQFQRLALEMGIGALFALALCSVLILVVSHRMAGPIFRLRKELTRIAETGKWQGFQFRKSDYLADLAPLLDKSYQAVLEARERDSPQTGDQHAA